MVLRGAATFERPWSHGSPTRKALLSVAEGGFASLSSCELNRLGSSVSGRKDRKCQVPGQKYRCRVGSDRVWPGMVPDCPIHGGAMSNKGLKAQPSRSPQRDSVGDAQDFDFDSIYWIHDVVTIARAHRCTIYRWIQRGTFPRKDAPARQSRRMASIYDRRLANWNWGTRAARISTETCTAMRAPKYMRQAEYPCRLSDAHGLFSIPIAPLRASDQNICALRGADCVRGALALDAGSSSITPSQGTTPRTCQWHCCFEPNDRDVLEPPAPRAISRSEISQRWMPNLALHDQMYDGLQLCYRGRPRLCVHLYCLGCRCLTTHTVNG